MRTVMMGGPSARESRSTATFLGDSSRGVNIALSLQTSELLGQSICSVRASEVSFGPDEMDSILQRGITRGFQPKAALRGRNSITPVFTR